MPSAAPDAAPSSATGTPSMVWPALVAGGIAGLAAALVFATAHAIIIVPIWNRMWGGVAFATIAGIAAGWAFAELELTPAAASGRDSRPAPALSGMRYGASLWLAVLPVTLVDSVLRLAGLASRAEWVEVAVAVVLATAGGVVLGSVRAGTNRARIAGAAAALMLTIAMAGPVPLPNGRRAIAIFLAVLPACLVAGLVLSLLARRAALLPPRHHASR
jgi:hypothetical protein